MPEPVGYPASSAYMTLVCAYEFPSFGNFLILVSCVLLSFVSFVYFLSLKDRLFQFRGNHYVTLFSVKIYLCIIGNLEALTYQSVN